MPMERRKGIYSPTSHFEGQHDTRQSDESYESGKDEDDSQDYSPSPDSPNKSKSPPLNTSKSSEDEAFLQPEVIYKESSGLPWALVIFAVVFGLAILGSFVGNKSERPASVTKNCSILLDLSPKFPNQDAFFWRTIKVSVESVLRDEPPQPTVIVFVYNENAGDAQKLISRISSTITSCFERNPQPLLLSAKDFNRADMIKDYGLAISKYREQLKSSIVMFVHEIQKVPAQVVEAFHTFCDKQTPLVDQSIILFSLELPDAKAGNLYDLVEDKLTALWENSVPMNKIQPLLARMTETVLFLETKQKVHE